MIPVIAAVKKIGLRVCAAAAAALVAGPAFAQAPTTAVLTRWDIFAGTGGVNTTSANATQNPQSVTLDPANGTVWFTTQRPFVRLGSLDPSASSNNYREWSVAGTAATPTGISVYAPTGDVWLTTGSNPELLMKVGNTNTFRRFKLPVVGTTTSTKTHRPAVTADGSAVFVSIPENGTLTGVIRIPRGANDLGVPVETPVSVTAQHWRMPSQTDRPRHLTLDGRDIIWLTNARDNTLFRIDPATNAFKRWSLPAGSNPADLSIVNGPDGFAKTVCVVSEGATTAMTGVAQCMDAISNASGGNDFTIFTRPVGLGLPQQVAAKGLANGSAELFVSEHSADALSFITESAWSVASIVSRNVSTGALSKTTPTVQVTDGAPLTPATRTVASSTTVVNGIEDPTGQVRFALPALDPLPGASLPRNSRPVGLTQVVTDALGTSVYVAESFENALAEERMAGVISRVTLGAAVTILQATPSSLTFEADQGTTPAPQTIAIDRQGGGVVPWSATKTQPWLTLSAASGDTPASLTVTVDPGSRPAGTYVDTVTVTGGVAPLTIPVTLKVVQRPTMVITPSLLAFTAVNTDTTPPAPKTFAISSDGDGTLEWTATVDIPGVQALLEVAGEPLLTTVSGTGPAVVTLHLQSVPGTAGLREGTITITSPNATNSAVVVDVGYQVTSVTQVLVVDKAAITFDVVHGATSIAPQVVNVTNAGAAAVTWGTVFPYVETAPLPEWLHVTPEVMVSPGLATVPMTVTVDPSALAAGTHTAAITIDDHTGNSPPATVGVTLIVRTAAIEFSSDALVFPVTEAGAPATQTVTLRNPGDAPLVVTPQVTINNGGSGWLTVTPSGELTVAPGGSLPFIVTTNPAGLPVGTYTAQITVANPLATNGSDTVFITMTVAVSSDTTVPVISSVTNLTAEATSAAGVAVSYTAPTAVDAIDGVRPVSCSPASGATFALGTTPVTCSASDTSNNTATTTFTVSVTDTTAPTISAVANVTATATSAAGATVSFATPTASDLVDGTVAVSCSPASGSTFPVGATTVTCTATDSRGNAQSTSLTVTVSPLPDTTAPVIGTVTNLMAEATSAAGAVVIYTAPPAVDAIDGVRPVSCSPASGATFALGTTPVTCSASDSSNNTATTTFTVTVRDTTAPTITAPADQLLEATSAAGATATFMATATDLVSTPAITYSYASGSTFPLGTRTVDVTATDAAGNVATASFTVTVRDTTAPTLSLPANISVVGSPIGGGTVGATVTFVATATDLVSGTRPVTCSPASGTVFPLGTTTVNCSASDLAVPANTVSGSFTVTVSAPAVSFTLGSSALYFKTGRLAYCNGLPVGPNWKDQGLVVTNTGGASLTYSATTATGWIRILPATGSLGAGASTTLVVSVNLSGLGRGIYQGAVTIAAGGTSKVVPVTLEIGNALPTLCLTPKDSPFGTVKAGKASTTKYFDILNVGDDPLGSWTLTKTTTQGSITTSLSSGIGPRTLSMSVKAGTTKGTQYGTITVNATGAVQSGQQVLLSWTVQ